jgi:hypothetical protein
MRTLQILLPIAMCIVILDSIRVGWLATRPASRSRKPESREGSHGRESARHLIPATWQLCPARSYPGPRTRPGSHPARRGSGRAGADGAPPPQ